MYIRTNSYEETSETATKVLDQLHLAIMRKDISTARKLLFWLNTWSDDYLLNENSFDYDSLIAYKRGMVLKADFGFNVGSEQGGLHYALVLDNENKKSNRTLMVVPLGSLDERKSPNDINKNNEVFLGYGLFKEEIEKVQRKIINKNEQISDLKTQGKSTKREEIQLGKLTKKLSNYKKGTVALLNQTCALSKIRIHSPCHSGDELYSFVLDDGLMSEVESKFMELFLSEEISKKILDRS